MTCKGDVAGEGEPVTDDDAQNPGRVLVAVPRWRYERLLHAEQDLLHVLQVFTRAMNAEAEYMGRGQADSERYDELLAAHDAIFSELAKISPTYNEVPPFIGSPLL